MKADKVDFYKRQNKLKIEGKFFRNMYFILIIEKFIFLKWQFQTRNQNKF